MPTILTHGIVALVLGKVLRPGDVRARFWLASVGCAVVPDVDVVGFAFGVRYEDLLGHRGLTHSLSFALALSAAILALAYRELQPFSPRWLVLTVYFFTVTASHGVLDAMTNGGLGVAFFAPFSNTRYFLPWQPLEVSPIGLGPFLSARGLAVLVSELKWIWVPAALVVFASILGRRILQHRSGL